MAADRKPFHKQCVKCFKCHKALNPATINEHQNQLFCKACYDAIFMPQEYSTGNYGGIVTPDDIRRREEEERRRAEKAERAKRERRCPGCDMKVHNREVWIDHELYKITSCCSKICKLRHFVTYIKAKALSCQGVANVCYQLQQFIPSFFVCLRVGRVRCQGLGPGIYILSQKHLNQM
jgi:hypothetical protein